MADRRRRSPEGSSRTKGREPARSAYDEPARVQNYQEQPRMRASAEERVVYSSSSSSSSSYIDISRPYPRKFGLRTFFTAPSERRRLRRRRSSRLFRNANSSSSSVNSDLAYGTGFIKRPKRRGVRARNGREIGTERHNERASDRENNRRTRGEGREEAARGPLAKAQTEAEILAIGAGLAKLARDQNRRDLKNGSRGDLIAGGSTAGFNNQGTSRGLVNSRPSHGSDTVDEEGWESASESEESVDSRLAFGDTNKNSGGFFGLFGKKKGRPLSRKDSVVDPRLFGPQNTLHGIITEPVGFGAVTPWASTNDFGQQFSEGPGTGPSHTSSQASLQRVYPVPTSDPGRFDARAASVVSGPDSMVISRPGPIPIQQPQPMVPISQSVYGRTESGNISKRDSTSSGRGKSLAEAALVGVAGATGAAVGAAIASSRDDRKRREGEEFDERNRIRRRDSEKESKGDRRREKRSSPDREDRREKRREKDDSSRVSSDKRREKRKDETREERDERRERRRDEPRDDKDERRSERFDGRGEVRRTKSETAVPTTIIDPFQYQVPDDAFPSPIVEPSQRSIETAPAVHYVTVEREPDFSRIAPIRDARTPDFMHMHRQNPPKYVDSGPGDREYDSRDRALREAEEIYEETTHSTAPIAAAAFGAAVAAVHHADAERETRSEKRRDERRGEKGSSYDDYDSKSSDKKTEKERDPIQEEADRAYREIVMARKIASQVIRSRSNSPNRSVVEKYTAEEEEEPVRIVTPPGMEEKKKVGPYDAPNADFQLDHVLEDPLDLRNFRISPTNIVRVDAEGPYLKRDPDADRPRPFLNLVRPTPAPSPAPEKQAARSEPSTSSKSKDRKESKRSSTSDVQSKDEVVDSPTSNVSKAVTWGENETKHFEVESPSEHRDEFVSKYDINAREAQEEPQPVPNSKPNSKGWGALRGAFMGAGVGAVVAAAANSSEASKTSKSKEDEKKDASYEYRGVIVEPESSPQSSNQENAPPAGPKPSSSETSRVPGAFDDDLGFTATVAAGLQDSGFDPNIVIDDPSFRRRDSPPGSNDFKPYRAPFAETVSDLGATPSEVSGTRGSQGFILGEVASTPQDWRSVSPPREDETPTKLSKKEQKKRDKERRRSGDVTPLEDYSATQDVVEEPASYFEPPLSKKEQKKRDKLARQNSQGDDITPSVADEIVEEPESYIETPKKSKKKSKKGSSSVDDYAEETFRDVRKVSVPVDAFDDLRNDDEWADAKKSKKKSKRDSDRYDSPARSVPSSEIASELDRSSSKKSKDKSNRKNEQYEPDPTEISLPNSTPSETSRDGDFDESRGNKKSSTRDSGIFNSADRGDSRSVVSADAGRYDDDEPRKSKKSRSSTKDDYDDSRSVVSAPAGDDYDESKRSKKRDKEKDKEKDKKGGGGFFGLFGSRSDVGARDESPKEAKDDFEEPKKKKKSKRSSVADSSSIYGDIGAQSVGDLSRSISNGNGDKNGTYDGHDEEDGDDYGEKSKTRSRSESSSSKKDSFLGNAGTLGAGVGIAGAAVAIAAQQYQQSKAENANSRETIEHEQRKSSPSSILPHEIYDPEITERQFRPSIDPQYGDLLPLPPSNPVSPNVDPIDDLPELPDSRPDTPEPERISREKSMSAVRKTIQETPMKSPSQSAVPLNFLMRNRSQPSSPRFVRSSPMQSPATPNEDSLSFPKSRPRPTSWDSTKEYKPLYLVESHRRGSSAQLEMEEELPALPPSQRTSRSSSQLEVGELAKDPLSIDTELASSKSADELLGSEQSTPKAAVMTQDDHAIDDSFDDLNLARESSLPSQREQRSSSPEPKSHFGKHVAETAAAAGLVSTIGYFASSPTHAETKESSLDELPPVPRQPSPVDPMTKDRSSYLLQSSPMSKKFEEFESADRDLNSPSRKQKSSRSSSNAMESIQEREAMDAFGSLKAEPEDIELEREKTMHVLSSSPREELAERQAIYEPDQQAKVVEDREIDDPTFDEDEPVDEFTFTKSKKDKKDKKKGKGLSRSSTQDDFAILEPSNDKAEETMVPATAEPAEDEFFVTKSKKGKKKGKGLVRSLTEDDMAIPEPSKEIAEETTGPAEPADDEFFVPKSKKDKKKSKGLPRSSTQDNFAIPESGKDITEETTAQAKAEPVDDELVVTKSKKDKKKDRKQSKSVSAWEPEEPESVALQIEEPVPKPTQDVPEELELATPTKVESIDEFPTSRSKKDKKKEKRKSIVAWEPETSESLSQTIEEPEQEPTRALPEDNDIATAIDNEPVDEFFTTKSKKDKKKDKRKSLVAWEPETSETTHRTVEELPQEPFRSLSEDISVPVDNDPVDEFVTTKSKKGKKKAKAAWEPEEESASQPFSEPTTGHSRAFTEETITHAETEAPEEFPFTKSKKDEKKDKNWSKLTSGVGSERDETEAQALGTSRDLVEEPVSILHEPSASEPAEDSTITQQDQGGKAEAEFVPRDNEQEPVEKVARESPAGDDFTTFETKKGKKKKGKSLMSWGQEDETAIPTEPVPPETQQEIGQGTPEAAPPADDFFVTKSKKGKKDKKKRGEPISAWEPEEESAPMPDAPKVDDTQGFEAATFKRGKKKNSKSSAFVEDDNFASPSKQGPAESLVTQNDTPRSIDAQTTAEGQMPAESSSTTEQATSTEPENILNAPMSLSSKPTPVGGPGAWPITPATPWTGGEVPESSSKEYFPSTEALRPSLDREMPEDSQSKKSFPFAETILPVVAAGATLLGVESLGKETLNPSEDLAKEATSSRSPDINKPSISLRDSKPDGFTAGYGNDQLSLAKRLQEEFSSGSKKSKKDKKRQSLPPTPAREASRSRAMEELPESHPRARSLSVGPAAANTYSEDQLDLARQLKADFEYGSKKSKKDKKKRQGLSRSSTQDGTSLDRNVEDSQVNVSEINNDSQDLETSETVPKGDGFAAGYQEDQLSLARQLQAEFGKKSKKDKKRRSTSQTPQDQEPRDDYLGEPSRAPISDMMEEERAAQTPLPNVQNTTRDGMAVGYSEEQLEFARQLKEEFGSGSKKGKKDKKDKKRRSTSQTPLEQEPRDDYFGELPQARHPDEAEQDRGAPISASNTEMGPARDGLAVGYKEEQLELARQLKDEFASGSKKSKKDKKDKKRGSLLRSNTEDDFSSDAQPRDLESGNFEAQQPEITEASPAIEPEDEFAFMTKKSKKDKKDKKRGSLLRSNTEDNFSSDTQQKDVDSRNIKTAQELAEAGPINEPEDESTFTTKKSKKDKKGKKRASLLPDTQGEDFTSEPVAGTAEDAAKSRDIDVGETSPFEQGVNESALQDDFAFTKKSKKDKKGKKRDSILQSTAENDLPSETRLEGQDESRDADVPAQPAFTPEFSAEPVAVEPQDEFSGFSKKSKKDKKGKKRDSVVQTPAEEDIPSVDFGKEVEALHASRDIESRDIDLEAAQAAPEDDWSLPAMPSKNDEKKAQSTTAQEELHDYPDVKASSTQPEEELITPNATSVAVDETTDDFGFSSKKSKKDKKKRGSLLRSSIFNETSEEKAEQVQPEPESRDLGDHANVAIAPVADDQDDVFQLSSKKSRKDKKKRGSLLRSSTFDETPEEQAKEFEVESESRDLGDASGVTTTPLAEEQDAGLEYSSKKPKKDKKKRGSLLRSSTFDETPEEQFKDDDVQPELESRDLGDGAGISITLLVDDQDEEFEYSSEKSKKDKKKRKSSQQIHMLEDLPKDVEEPHKQDAAVPSSVTEDLLSSILESDRAPEVAIRETTFDEDKSLSPPAHIKTEHEATEPTTREAAFDQDVSINEPEEVSTSGPPDIFHDFAFTTKKSKKDKKARKDPAKDDSEETSGLSTPLDPMADPPIIEKSMPAGKEETEASDKSLERVLDSFTVPASKPQDEEPAGDWSSLSVKKSKKDKKRKSSSRTASVGPSITPLETILEPEVTTEERQLPANDLIQADRATEEPSSQVMQESVDRVAAEDSIEAPTDEWASFSTKKPKKDKKKSKSLSTSQPEGPSEVSTPSNPIIESETRIVEPSSPTENTSKEPLSRELPQEPEGSTDTMTKDNIEEQVDEWVSFATKESRKGKKKRKSGLSPPARLTEESSAFEPEESFVKEFHERTIDPTQSEHDVPPVQVEESLSRVFDGEIPMSSETHVQDSRELEPTNKEFNEQEAPDDDFAFITKRSKKDKKGSKRSSRAPSESRATTSGPADALSIAIAETENHLSSEQIVLSPVAMKNENLEQTYQAEQHYDKPVVDDEREDAFGRDLSRTPSKKDKRKRQATVAEISLDDGMDTSKPPLTSWADEVEEAEVEREVPVIQDIAKDESLSHIASTTESAPVDDFLRPTKKGKKSKKRISEPVSSVESSRPATSSGMPKVELSDDHSNITILAAAGAALTGAALLSKSDDTRESSSKSAGATTPQRKLSKKEKKKKSIDLGPTPRDDIFDDPALWEGAEPKPHEEIRHVDDDAGSDGFGFASRDMDEPISTHEPHETRVPTPGYEEYRHVAEVRSVSPAAENNFIPEGSSRAHERGNDRDDSHTAIEPSQENRDLPWERLQERQFPEEPDHQSSTRDEGTAQLPSSTYLPEEPIQHREEIRVNEQHFSGPSRSIVNTPSADKGVSFEEPPPITYEHISTPSRASSEQPHAERSVAFEDVTHSSPARPLSTSKYGRTSFSDLPVVHEESEHLPPHPQHDFEGNRDSAFVTGSPIPHHQGFTDDHEHVRDSGVHLRDFSPAEKSRAHHSSSTDAALARLSWPQVDEETETVDLHRSQRPVVEPSTGHHHRERVPSETHDSHSHESRRPRGEKATDFYQPQRSTEEKSTHHDKAPLTSRELFPSYKSAEERSSKHHDEGTSQYHRPSQHNTEERQTDLHRVPTIHESRKPREDSLVKQRLQRFESPDLQRTVKPKEDKYAELATSSRPKAERPKGMSEVEASAAIAGASLGFAAARKLSQEQRPPSAQSQRSSSNINRLRTPDPKRPDSVASNRSGTPPLRRSDRKLSGDLRSLSQRSKPDLAKEAELAALASSASASPNPTANEGRVRAKDMATDVYDGFGEGRMGSPRSPTRPHSMRRRQSMQVLDLESKVEQLAAENRMLAEAKAQAERTLASTSHASPSLLEKDAEIDGLKRTLDWLQNEVTRLTQVNEGLNSAHVELGRQHNERYGTLESQHAQATRELQEVRDAHDNLSVGMEGIVRDQVQGAMQDKDEEIAQLRAELDAAKEQIREMQRQILASKANEVDFLTVRDEDYFDNACQSLCQHVRQWVLRFSKFSDMRACRLSSEINNDKTIDRLDNAILDGSDVDSYLADRIKRRDVFMSMTMNMVWEFIFTRYLFGMDREQRQKLKSLEKTLSEVGPAAAVHHWRATTLTLLSKRDAFIQQREQDTQAVVHAIIETLSEILPPPSNLEAQIEEQLTRVMKEAVDLSIEMRTQRAEYMMLPPLLPEYDANGDLAGKVFFNAALMNERSGDTVSNEELEAQKAVVRVVLFPLVVKKGDDRGEGDEEIVVCPAQVLVAKPKKSVRVFSPGSAQGHSRVSLQSNMPADYGEGSVI